MDRRASGILLHVTSLPSRFGIGDLGPGAYRWVDLLARARQRWWQVLPVGPPAAESSPYLPQSAFAGNPLLVSPELLAGDGWLDAADLAALEQPSSERVDYASVERAKAEMFERAYDRFAARGDTAEFDAFVAVHGTWLHPFAAFRRRPGRNERLAMFEQFVFDRQWRALRAYAGARGVGIFGDVPFYVAGDSADVWRRPELFKLDEAGRARAVAGVPPDAFSETGQLWGNPVYDWPAHARDDFAWWRARMRRNAEWFDAVRLDHFRGFAAHWEVPAGSRGAAGGRWVDGPGDALVRALVAEVGGTRLVAEDLGLITDDVEALMRAHALPGMKVLLFAFDGGTGDNPHAPHHHAPQAVVYTGTHDNNTARGWFEHDAGPAARAQLARYLGRPCGADEVAGELVRMAMMSVCRTAIIPAQDLLGLGEGARMNRPATVAGNWAWRLTPAQMGGQLVDTLADLTEATGRA